MFILCSIFFSEKAGPLPTSPSGGGEIQPRAFIQPVYLSTSSTILTLSTYNFIPPTLLLTCQLVNLLTDQLFNPGQCILN
jgi:hypothetical protein